MLRRVQSAKTDYQAGMLPQTRREVFFDAAKLNWGKFLLYGAVMLVFSLPLQISALCGDLFVVQLQSASAALPEGTGQLSLAMSLMTFSLIKGVVDIFGGMVCAVGCAGMARVVRQHAWEENVYFRYEFAKGMRQNSAQYLLISLLVGFACLLFQALDNALLLLAGSALEALLYLPAAILLIVCVPMLAYTAVAVSLYENPFCKNLQISRTLYKSAPGKTVLVCFGCLSPLLLQCIPHFYWAMAGRIIAAFAAPWLMLIWFLFTFDRLDETIHQTEYPELLGRGLFSADGQTD